MPDLTSFANETRTDTIELQGTPVTVTYTPDVFTPEMEEQVATAPADAQARTLAKLLEALLVDWDITKGEEPFPPVYDNLKTLPVTMLVGVVSGIGALIKPSEAEGKA